MKSRSLNFQTVLTIYVNYNNINIIIRNSSEILYLEQINNTYSLYHTRRKLIDKLINLIDQYQIDAILMQQNKLTIDNIDRYPDPLVLHNLLLEYSIKISVEDNFYTKVTYIFEVPFKDWYACILNYHSKNTIDVYKTHIINQPFSAEQLETIEKFNYYKALCFSECIWFDKIKQVKYQINKGD